MTALTVAQMTLVVEGVRALGDATRVRILEVLARKDLRWDASPTRSISRVVIAYNAVQGSCSGQSLSTETMRQLP